MRGVEKQKLETKLLANQLEKLRNYESENLKLSTNQLEIRGVKKQKLKNRNQQVS